MTDTYHAYNTIFLKSGRSGDPLQKEGQANAAITPGMLIEEMTTGKFRKHATAGGNAAGMFAIEDALQGNDIDDDYAADAQIQYMHFGPGDEVYAWLADGENVTIGTFLESAGNGYLRASDPISSFGSHQTGEQLHRIVAIAREAKQSNTSTSEGLRLLIEIV